MKKKYNKNNNQPIYNPDNDTSTMLQLHYDNTTPRTTNTTNKKEDKLQKGNSFNHLAQCPIDQPLASASASNCA
jgi:hypothetical protein